MALYIKIVFLKEKLLHCNTNRLFDGLVFFLFCMLVCFIKIKADSFLLSLVN